MPLPALFDRLRLPVIASPLFIISNPDMVIAQCHSGMVIDAVGPMAELVARRGRGYAAARARIG